jgi:hypothetical protein
VVYSYNKTNEMYEFLKFIFWIELYMFWTGFLSIIRSLNTVRTAIGICHTGYADCLLVGSGSILIMDRKSPKHVEFHCKNKLEKSVHLVGFLIRIYHNARSSEFQKYGLSSKYMYWLIKEPCTIAEMYTTYTNMI